MGSSTETLPQALLGSNPQIQWQVNKMTLESAFYWIMYDK